MVTGQSIDVVRESLRIRGVSAPVMNQADESGWEDIHVCAAKGYLKSLEQLLDEDKEVLERKTRDELRQTPLLVAARHGQIEAAACLINLGANANAVDSYNRGAVELCALNGHITLLRSLLSTHSSVLPVWSTLMKMLTSDVEQEVAAAGRSLLALIDTGRQFRTHSAWTFFYDHGGVAAVLKVARSSLSFSAKLPALQTLLCTLERLEIQEQLVSAGGIPVCVNLLDSSSQQVAQAAAEALCLISRTAHLAEALMEARVVSAILMVLQTVKTPEVLVPVIQCLGHVAETSPRLQTALGRIQGLPSSLLGLFEEVNQPALLSALTNTVSKMVEKNNENQNSFMEEGLTQQLMNMMRSHARNKEIHASSVEAIHRLAEGNRRTQDDLVIRGADHLLMQMLKRSRTEILQEKILMALWAIAGENRDARWEVSHQIGATMLIEFVNSKIDNLHYIGSEALGVLARGPKSQKSQFAGGLVPLIQLLSSNKEHVLLSVLSTLRFLCVGVGCVPHKQNQTIVFQCQGVRLLVDTMVQSTNEIVQVEAAHTLGCLALGHKEILKELFLQPDFSYVRLLKMLYSRLPAVRLTAGSALAYFAYNNLHQQREMIHQGGVRFSCFLPFLQSDEELFRCHAAYQVIILARMMPDETHAKSSTAGIKILVDLLKDSKSEEILALVADFVARLGHTRAGIPAALIAVNTIDYLCRLLLSPAEDVRGNAAIALSYLCRDHQGERIILHRCRNDPYLMRVIRYYSSDVQLAPTFREGWQHYRRVGLPPISEGRPSLVHRRPQGENVRPIINVNTGDEAGLPGSDSADFDHEKASVSSTATSRRNSSQINTPTPLHSQRLHASRASLLLTGNKM